MIIKRHVTLAMSRPTFKDVLRIEVDLQFQRNVPGNTESATTGEEI